MQKKYLIGLLLFFIGLYQAQAQTHTTAQWTENQDATWTHDFYNETQLWTKGDYPIYYNKVFFYDEVTPVNNNPFLFPEYVQRQTWQDHYGGKTSTSYVKPRYKIDGTEQDDFLFKPENYSSTSIISCSMFCHAMFRRTGNNEDYNVNYPTGGANTTFTITIEHPKWDESVMNNLNGSCIGENTSFLLSSAFTGVNYHDNARPVKFYLDTVAASHELTADLFSTSLTTSGNHKLIATKEYDNGAKNTTYKSEKGLVSFEYPFLLLATPTIQVDSTVLEICQNAPIYQFLAKPEGGAYTDGTWSGNGIDAAGNFNPSNATIGNNIVTYTYSPPNGCTVDTSFTVNVLLAPEVTTTDFSVCPSTPVFDLNTKAEHPTPLGGTYTVVGGSTAALSGSMFDASQMSGQPVTIRYDYANGGGCTGSKTFVISLLTTNEFNVGLDMITCNTSDLVNLNERPNVMPADNSIVWSGDGVVSGKFFDPSAVSLGLHVLTGKWNNGTCVFTKSISVQVKQGETVDAGGAINVCKNEPDFYLSGATPSGGTWSGDFVDDQGQFLVSQAPIGAHTVYYTYNNGTCGITKEKIINVTVPPTVTVTPNVIYVCQSDSLAALPTPNHTGGTWTPINGGFYDPTKNPDVVFVQNMQVGENLLRYTYQTPNSCAASDTVKYIVKARPELDMPAPISICQAATPIPLDAQPSGGTWSGAGVSNGFFDPSGQQPGAVVLTYSYTDPNTGCSAIGHLNVNVLPKPNIDVMADTVICQNSGMLPLSANPSTGTWSGSPAINGNAFNPALSGVGVFNLTYTYQPSNGGCEGVAYVQIKVIPPPNVVVTPNKMTLCQSDSLAPLPSVNIPGGTWTAIGSNFYDDQTGSVLVRNMQEGDNYLVYGVGDGTGCIGYDTINYYVQPLPIVTLPNPIIVCANGDPIQLNAQPTGGQWSGTGVSNNVFYPQDHGIGEDSILYTFTDPTTGCTVVKSLGVTVLSLPELTVMNDTTICETSGLLQLSATPLNGTWSGSPALSGTNFDPSQSGTGTFQVSYTYQATQEACSVTKSVKITVVPPPGAITIKGDTIVCTNSVATIQATAENATDFEWSIDGQLINTGATFSYKVTAPVKVGVRAVGLCTTPYTYFNLLPNTPTGSISRPDSTKTGDLFIAYSSVKAAAGSLKYLWNFGDGSTSTEATGKHYYYAQGKYKLSLQVTSTTGCTAFFDGGTILVGDGDPEITPPVYNVGDGEDKRQIPTKGYPTVFSDQITIEAFIPTAQTLTFQFINENGHLLHTEQREGQQGNNKFVFTQLDKIFRNSGNLVVVKMMDASGLTLASFRFFKL